MIEIELTPNEIDILLATLESDLSELRSEIAHTDAIEFRNKLKERKTVLERVVATLESKRASA
jgi:hypothetical protein